MYKIIIVQNNEKTIWEAKAGTRLSDFIRQTGRPFSMPCSGNHTCGKCKVKLSGKVSGITEKEMAFLSKEEQETGVRLACFTEIQGDTIIELPNMQQMVMLDGRMEQVNLSPMTVSGYGVAFDIGTTTVAGYLYSLADGELCAALGEPNQQALFGADVISRIQYANEHSPTVLCDVIRRQLCGMVNQLAEKGKRSVDEISCVVVTGNTTMLHFFTGLDPSGIAQYPFTPKSLFGCEWPAEIFSVLKPGTLLYLPGCISSYVGADITCSILASGMMHSKTGLLLDLGTNGEMALWKNGTCTVCSTAAGPAFEGTGLYQGMPAEQGAINMVSCSPEGRISYSVIGEGSARGICGSGIIDALAVVRTLGFVDETGRIIGEEDHPELLTEINGVPALAIGDSGVVVTQQDIRQIQLAKAAIAAGVQTLLYRTETRPSEIEKLYLAGGFGNCVHPKSAVSVGLFPALWLDRIEVIGNGAGAGASLLMLDCSIRESQEQLLASVSEITLSSDSYFMEAYVEQMMFEE